MTNLLALLLLSFGLGHSPAPADPAQTFCPPETPRGREVVVAYATGNHGGTRLTGVPIRTQSQVRLLVDSNPADRAACDRLRAIVASQRTDGAGSPTGYDLTFYYVEGNYYAVAVSSTPVVQPVSPARIRVNLRWIPVYVTDASFRLLGGVAM
jgi:hypothetical protein